MSQSRTAQLSAQGVSIWLDDLSRERIVSGELKRLIDERDVVGVTTNPTIFAKALSQAHAYDEKVRELAAKGADADQAVFELTTSDVRDAADILREVYDKTDGKDGRVSIEVGPALARDTQGTIAEAKRLWEAVDRPNVMVKIPATKEGLEAITESIAVGISINVTLIFGLERYREVINAYLTGLEKARQAGIDLSTIRSVASFFVSRVDSEIDQRLDDLGTDSAATFKGQAAVANARLAYEVFEQGFSSERARLLLDAGAHRQRPLWASTGVKNPDYPDTMYVTDLVADDVVNTMPEKTLEAVADHAEITSDTVTGTYTGAREVLDSIAELGISYTEVVELLEREGIDKFVVSWNELTDTVSAALAEAK